MILGRDLLNDLGLDLKFYERTIIVGGGPYEGWSAPMVDSGNSDFTSLTYKIVKREEYFTNLFIDKLLESDSAISSTRRIPRILDDKYENANLNKVMEKKCQNLDAKELYILPIFTEVRRSVQRYVRYVWYHSNRLGIKVLRNTSIFVTLSSTKGAFKKGSWNTCKIGGDRTCKWIWIGVNVFFLTKGER